MEQKAMAFAFCAALIVTVRNMILRRMPKEEFVIREKKNGVITRAKKTIKSKYGRRNSDIQKEKSV